MRDKMLETLLENGEVTNFEAPIKKEDGSIMWVQFSGKLTSQEGFFEGVATDITERKQAEESLRESEEKFRTLVEESPLGIALIDKDGSYKYVNPVFKKIFGYSLEDVAAGKEWFEKAYPNQTYREQVVRSWIEDKKQSGVGQMRPRVYNVTCKDGSQKEIQFRSVTLENLDQFIIYEDITARSKIERQLQQAQKFEAIGTLAGGIAHDFNNLLMGIQGRASLMALEMDPSPPQLEHIEAIEEYVRSATNLTRQLLGFARGGKYEVKPIDLNDLVRASSTMFGRTRKEIQIDTNFRQSPLVVEADRQQIEQVLLNMYVNAWQAMPDGGKLFLETNIVKLDEADGKSQQVEAGQYAKISIMDTGTGIEEAIRQRIFDPFFTTKEKGRGTGLGLASAYGIIKNHAGMITVYSEIGHGTAFNIYLPVSDQNVHREEPADGGLIKGSETILLVDDEEMIINVSQAMLKKLGYGVIVANDGEQAIEKISEIGDEIDLVILDLVMPGIDGGVTFDRIREIQPEIPVLLSSGYAINGKAYKVMRRGCNGFIQKPFNISELSKKVRNVLNAAKSSNI
jgi:PAS domain S-box-containing protein